MTNAPGEAESRAVTETFRSHNGRAPVLAGHYEVIGVRDLGGGQELGAHELARRRLLAFAGVGSPAGFAHTLRTAGVELAGLIEYPDHHWFTAGDLRELAAQASSLATQGLVTTEKDSMRLRSLTPPPVPLWVVRVRLRLDAGRDQLLQLLDRTLAAAAARP